MDVKYCRHQHQVLVNCIQHALQCWGPLDDPSVSYWINDTVHSINDTVAPWLRIQLTPELKRVLTRARMLSRDCCTELPPLKAVLRHADRSQEFADIVKEIQWCTAVVSHGFICANVRRRSTLELKDFPWQAKIGYQEQFLLEIAAIQDWWDLSGRLDHVRQGNHKCSVEDCGNTDTQMDPTYCLVEQARQSQESDGPKSIESLLWRFDSEVVKHGRPLGSGSFGFVTQVTWLGFRFAQKNFNACGLHSLPTEAKALVRLNHPHIVKVYAYSEDSLLMDLMCTDLDKFMKSRMKGGTRNQPFSFPAAMDLMLQIADAVNYIHSQKVAHRDLKSSNILVNPVNTLGVHEDDGFVFAKIGDFSLAKVKRDITGYSHLTHNVGTRRWMAPEIFAANIEDDHLEHAFPMKADVYSFGIICFEILTGKEPFCDEPLSTLYSKLSAPIPLRPQLPSSCPTNLASLICECWDTDPRKRPSFGDVCQVLRYLKGLPTLIALRYPWSHSIDGEWPFGRLPVMVKNEGPWGGSCRPQEVGILRTVETLGDIRGVQFLFNDLYKCDFSGFKIVSFNGEHRIERIIGGDSKGSSEWFYFEEDEFLVQVEGSTSPSGVEYLTFITTKKKYGSSKKSNIFKKLFCSNRGRVVGFTWVFVDSDGSSRLCSLEVHTVDLVQSNIVRCLQQYLGNEESIS